MLEHIVFTPNFDFDWGWLITEYSVDYGFFRNRRDEEDHYDCGNLLYSQSLAMDKYAEVTLTPNTVKALMYKHCHPIWL